MKTDITRRLEQALSTPITDVPEGLSREAKRDLILSRAGIEEWKHTASTEVYYNDDGKHYVIMEDKEI